ncbi:MAG: formylglycine-generating enzyme family protein [Gammaproteobacteria bacterium]|nr:formylglycine-generating enzyme family protein [Gammaproteobacteria bacterium]
MSSKVSSKRSSLTKEELVIRKRYIGATFVTCIVIALVAGSIHVVQIGSTRMEQLRDMSGYDLKDEHKKIRGAGEDLFVNVFHERGVTHTITYTMDEAEGLLPTKQWVELETSVNIPAGLFTMGTDSLKSDVQNRPAHTVDLPAYAIDKFLVTNSQYARYVAQTGQRVPLNWSDGHFPAQKVMHPVTMISWFDAKGYCGWMGKRLPTEAEWEKAARGDDGRRWPWGDVMDTKRLNTYYNVGSTTSVDTYKNGVSPYGVYDMSGNVLQWTADDFNPYPKSSASDSIFKGKKQVVSDDPSDRKKKVANFIMTEDKYKVMRGGSWKGDPFSTSSYHRAYSWPHMTSDFYGFRCAKDIEPLKAEAINNDSSKS